MYTKTIVVTKFAGLTGYSMLPIGYKSKVVLREKIKVKCKAY